MTTTSYEPAPIPEDEAKRRQAVLRSGLMAMENDEHLLRICADAKDQLLADWAAVVVVIDGWQYVIASTGTHLGSYRRSACISSYALLDPKRAFYSLDCARDPKLAGSSYVSDGLIVFYAGAPVVDSDGYPVGVLCITNRSPRSEFSQGEQAMLTRLAAQVLLRSHGRYPQPG